MSRKVSIVLINDLKGKGKSGDVINVLEGYARNYLLPNGIAKIANDQAIKELEVQKKIKADKIEAERKNAMEIASIIDGKEVTVFMNSGENGKLFGSVTLQDVSDSLNQKFLVEIDKHNIQSESEKSVDTLGTHLYKIKLFQGVTATVTVNVCEKVKAE